MLFQLQVFKIRSVKPAVTILPTDPPPPSFFKTTEGIITLVFGCLAVLLAVIAFVLWRKHAKKRYVSKILGKSFVRS